jgi:hypothetical protein
MRRVLGDRRRPASFATDPCERMPTNTSNGAMASSSSGLAQSST